MGLPATREQDFSAPPGGPAVDVATLNKLQDLWVAFVTGTSTLFASGLSLKQLFVDGVGNQALSLAAGVVARITGGALQLDGASGDDKPAWQVEATPTDRKLVSRRYLLTSNGHRVYARTYADVNGYSIESINAYWDVGSTKWIPDDPALEAQRTRFNWTSYTVEHHAAAANWVESAWSTNVRLGPTGRLVSGGGTAFVNGDVTLGTHSWHDGSATIVGDDTHGVITITSGSTNAQTLQLLTLNFKDGTWGSKAPVPVACYGNGASSGSWPPLQASATNGVLTIGAIGAIDDNRVYVINYVCIG